MADGSYQHTRVEKHATETVVENIDGQRVMTTTEKHEIHRTFGDDELGSHEIHNLEKEAENLSGPREGEKRDSIQHHRSTEHSAIHHDVFHSSAGEHAGKLDSLHARDENENDEHHGHENFGFQEHDQKRDSLHEIESVQQDSIHREDNDFSGHDHQEKHQKNGSMVLGHEHEYVSYYGNVKQDELHHRENASSEKRGSIADERERHEIEVSNEHDPLHHRESANTEKFGMVTEREYYEHEVLGEHDSRQHSRPGHHRDSANLEKRGSVIVEHERFESEGPNQHDQFHHRGSASAEKRGIMVMEHEHHEHDPGEQDNHEHSHGNREGNASSEKRESMSVEQGRPDSELPSQQDQFHHRGSPNTQKRASMTLEHEHSEDDVSDKRSSIPHDAVHQRGSVASEKRASIESADVGHYPESESHAHQKRFSMQQELSVDESSAREISISRGETTTGVEFLEGRNFGIATSTGLEPPEEEHELIKQEADDFDDERRKNDLEREQALLSPRDEKVLHFPYSVDAVMETNFVEPASTDPIVATSGAHDNDERERISDDGRRESGDTMHHNAVDRYNQVEDRRHGGLRAAAVPLHHDLVMKELEHFGRMGDSSHAAKQLHSDEEDEEEEEEKHHERRSTGDIGGEQDLENEIFHTFKLFDFDGNGTIDFKDLGTVLRCLNLNPTQSQIKDLRRQFNGDSKKITWSKFYPNVISIIEEGNCKPASEDELISAFSYLDVEKKGYLTFDQLKHFLLNMGEPLNDEEFEQMLHTLTIGSDPECFNYIEYAKRLAC